MKEAKDLAILHVREIAAAGPLTSDELADLEEAIHLDFLAAKSRVGELQKNEFTESYESIRHPAPADVSLDVKVTSAPAPFVPTLSCPKCKSVHLSANKAGFGLGKAVVGGVLLGGVGLLGGFLGSAKVSVTCLQCGHSWKAGKA